MLLAIKVLLRVAREEIKSHAQIDLLWGFNSNFPTSISAPSTGESPQKKRWFYEDYITDTYLTMLNLLLLLISYYCIQYIQLNLSTTVTLGQNYLAVVERWPL